MDIGTPPVKRVMQTLWTGLSAVLTAAALLVVGAAFVSPPLPAHRLPDRVGESPDAPSTITLAQAPAQPTEPTRPKLRLPEEVELRDGDMIFVHGQSLHSRLVAWSFAGERYTHAGIVRMVDGQPWVIHAAPDFKQGGPLRGSTFCETLAYFLEEHPFDAGDVYRIADAPTAQTAAEAAHIYVERQTPFDAGGNTYDDSQLYCYELLWHAYRAAGVDLADDRMAEADLWLVRGPVVLASSIIDSPQVQHVTPLELR